MINRMLLVSFLLFSTFPVLANDVSKAIDELQQMSSVGYMLCQTKFKIAVQKRHLYGATSAEGIQGATDVRICVDSASAEVDKMVQRLRQQLNEKPKAEAALKDFYIEWRAIISNYAAMQGSGASELSRIKSKIETLRVEVAW